MMQLLLLTKLCEYLDRRSKRKQILHLITILKNESKELKFLTQFTDEIELQKYIMNQAFKIDKKIEDLYQLIFEN